MITQSEEIEIDWKDIPLFFKVEFYFCEGSPGSRWEPPEGDEFDIDKVWGGKEFKIDCSNRLGRDIYELIYEALGRQRERDIVDSDNERAVSRYEARMESLQYRYNDRYNNL